MFTELNHKDLITKSKISELLEIYKEMFLQFDAKNDTKLQDKIYFEVMKN